MLSNDQADEKPTSQDTEAVTGEVMSYQSLMDAYASAAAGPLPNLVISSQDYAAYSEQWNQFCIGRDLSTFDGTHFERFKGTAAMFGRYAGRGDRALELGTATLFGVFLKDELGIDLLGYDRDLTEPFDLETGSLDQIFCLDMISRLKDVPSLETTTELRQSFNYSGVIAMLAECHRVLKPGGLLLLTAPNATSVDVIAKVLRGEHPHLFDPHVREFAPLQIKAFAERVGFALEAFGTFFAWQTATTGERDRLLGVVADLGFEPANRGDEACYVLRKPMPGAAAVVYEPGVTDFDEMVGLGAAETAALFRDRHFRNIIPEYEDVLRVVYERFLGEGDVVVDVGVNIGRHYTRFHELVGDGGRVIGFEPVPDFAEHSLGLVGPHAEIRQKALSDAPGVGEFLFMTKAVGESGFKERESEGDRGATPIQVEIATLDQELDDLTALRYIKIDTEGHEISVLRGGTETLRRLRPLISVEWGEPTYALYGHDLYGLYDLAVELDYRLSDLFGNLVVSREEWALVSDQSYWDFFMVPSEYTEEWRAIFTKTAGTQGT